MSKKLSDFVRRVKCGKCNYRWVTKSKNRKVSCPHCTYKTSVTEV